MRKAFEVTILSCFLLIPQVLQAQTVLTLAFTEIMYDLDGADDGREWVEIYNYGSEPVDITTGSGSQAFRFFDGALHTVSLARGTSTIPAQGFAIFSADADVWLGEHSTFGGAVFDTVMSLKNSSGTIGLAQTRIDPLSATVQYDASWGGAGNGYSLERIDENFFESTEINWRESAMSGGTPGTWDLSSSTASSSATTTPQTEDEGQQALNTPADVPIPPASETGTSWSSDSYDIHINELLPNPKGSDTGEWIELYNNSPRLVDLAAWQIQDNSSHIFTIDTLLGSTTIEPFGYFFIKRQDTGIALNNVGGDKVILFAPNGDFRESVEYQETALEDVSWAHFPDGFRWTTVLTPGFENREYIGRPPVASFSITASQGFFSGEQIIFDASSSTDSGIRSLQYHWDFGDDGKDDEKITSHAFDGPGEYEIALTVSNARGQTSIISRKVTIEEFSRETYSARATPIPFQKNDLILTEIMPNPNGSDTREWAELKNTSAQTIDISGWQLDDAEGGSQPYIFPDATTISAQSYAVFDKGETKLSFNNDEDEVRIVTPQGEVWSATSYEKAPSGESFAYDEINEEWMWTDTPTLGNAFTHDAHELPMVRGLEFEAVDSFEDITEHSVGAQVHVEGVILVPPGILSKQRAYIAEISGDSYAPDALLELYQYHGLFPELSSGDRIEAVGEVSWYSDHPRIRIADSSDIAIIGHQALIEPERTVLSELSEDSDRLWAAIEGVIKRINQKSISVADGDVSLTVTPFGSVANFVNLRGAHIRATGFIRYQGGKAHMYTVQDSDIEVLDEHASSTENSSYAIATTTITASSVENSPHKKWFYFLTLPLAVGLGWLFKKYILTRFA